MNIEKSKQKMHDLFVAFNVCLSLRLEDPPKLKIIDCDVLVYDSYSYPTPSCYSIKISNSNNEFIKGSINNEDGECVLEILDTNYDDCQYIHRVSKNDHKFHSVRFNEILFDKYEFLGYFKTPEYFFDVLETLLLG